MKNLDELEAKAKAATPGPWEAVDYGTYDGRDEAWYLDTTAARADIAPDTDGVQPNHWDASRGKRDMQFIAAANPAAILALIAQLRARDETIRQLEGEVRERRNGPGTPAARFSYLLHELEALFPGVVNPVLSDPPEKKLLDAVRELRDKNVVLRNRLLDMNHHADAIKSSVRGGLEYAARKEKAC